MSVIDDVVSKLYEKIEAKPLAEDISNWYLCLNTINKSMYVPLQLKPGFISYQEAYFKNVYTDYRDTSMVLYRGGRPVGIWSICIYTNNEKIHFGTAGTSLMGPALPVLSKAEAQRAVIEKCLKALFDILEDHGGGNLVCNETVLDRGASQWMRKLMEHGAKVIDTKWQAFVDLTLSYEEIQSRIRRTNKYSVAKEQDVFDLEIYDESSENIYNAFKEFHSMHRKVAGRETRSELTWNIQEKIIREGSDKTGRSFLVFIRDKKTKELAGSALFDSTPQTGLYCVAAYDRSRFSKPVGHIIQAFAIERMKSYGLHWYEIGERAYPGDNEVNEKLIDIGHYKEGFATHLFPRVFVSLDSQTFSENILK